MDIEAENEQIYEQKTPESFQLSGGNGCLNQKLLELTRRLLGFGSCGF